MKVKNQDPAQQGPNNSKHTQEDTASHDYVEQRKKGAEETEAKAKKQKKSDKQ